MIKCVNGVCMPMTEEDIKSLSRGYEKPTYRERVIERIRDVYSVDDEIAIIRQRDTKPEEFSAYNEAVERIKAEEKSK